MLYIPTTCHHHAMTIDTADNLTSLHAMYDIPSYILTDTSEKTGAILSHTLYDEATLFL